MDWIAQYFRFKDEFDANNDLGSQMYSFFKRFLRDANLLDNKGFTRTARIVERCGLDSQSAWAIMLVNLAYTPQIGWFIKTFDFHENISRSYAVTRLMDDGTQERAANDIWRSYSRFIDLPFSEIGLGVPELFRESALLDRFHGFIKGWDIPRMSESMKICGWALNTAYFCEILHVLRDDVSYRAVVDELLDYDTNSDTRDVEAVKRIATGLMKLLFPNVRTAKDIAPKEFKDYCVRPAATMRSIIKYQMGLLDKEYRGKDIPKFSIREIGKEDE